MSTLVFFAGFVTTIIIGSIVEYVVHIFQHRRVFMGAVHLDHHFKGYGQGYILEFVYYIIPSSPFIALSYGLGWYLGGEWYWYGFGGAVGGFLYATVAAYVHQLHHDRPDLVFWMKQPVHYTHHAHDMRHKNYGIVFDFWDRLFGTYQAVEWNQKKPLRQLRPWHFLQIKWI